MGSGVADRTDDLGDLYFALGSSVKTAEIELFHELEYWLSST